MVFISSAGYAPANMAVDILGTTFCKNMVAQRSLYRKAKPRYSELCTEAPAISNPKLEVVLANPPH